MANSNTAHSKKVRAKNADKFNKEKRKCLPIYYYENDSDFIDDFKAEAKSKDISYIKLFKERLSK